MKNLRYVLIALILFAAGGAAATESSGGEVQIPLHIYNQLIDDTRPITSAPSGYALGQAIVGIQVTDRDGRATATISVDLKLDVLEDEWAAVPILPAGTPLRSATIDGKPVQLMHRDGSLVWGTKKSGSYTMKLIYSADAVRSDAGFVIPIPLPQAAATQFKAIVPGTGLDMAVIPAAGVVVTSGTGKTVLDATIPTTRGVQLSWREPVLDSHTISRAVYSGQQVGDALQWDVDLSVELSSDETVTLELLPAHVTLNEIQVDGKPAPVAVENDHFAAVVKGRGAHRVKLSFQVPIRRGSGPPFVELEIPSIPISRFDLDLPGRKEVSVDPLANVSHREDDKGTTAVFNIPMSELVKISWTEALPEDLQTEVRAHASVFHAAHAEEGVLYLRALVSIEVSRGELNLIEFDLPSDVQVNRIHSESGGISDWRIAPKIVDGRRAVSVFLDHPLRESMRLDVDFDRSLASSDQLQMPFLRVQSVQRQRGMMALLATKEIALKPADEADITRVGENQLPAFFRELLERTVAHTFKYVEALPLLVVSPATPDPVVAKFDAEINTLISLMDVTMRGSASANIRVKSGRLERIQLELPEDVNLLSLSAPSLRTHKVVNEGGRQLINVEFTQEMDGQFRIEANYERIASDADAELPVPTLSVVGAEVEQGRIAVEALAAVEVQVARSDQLSSVDPSELPQQLVLKTTNPILLAYKYVHTDPPYELALQITRHPEVTVQSASIDRAHYQTLFTQDGLAVTTARFTVRNNRKQFLRVRLPEGAQVWSATVAGRPEKPAISATPSDASDGAERPEILIKVINSIDGFPVELVYATPLPEMGGLGRVRAHLPQPDMIVTATRWDVFLPESFRYGSPDSNMNLAAITEAVTPELLRKEFGAFDESVLAQQPNHPLRIEVPAAGVHFGFEKLYANQSDQAAAFSIPYSSPAGARLGHILALFGGLLFWGGIAFGVAKLPAKIARAGFAAAAAGISIAIGSISYFGTNPIPVAVGSALMLTALLARAAATQWKRSSVEPGA
jgi:hypothetical protein